MNKALAEIIRISNAVGKDSSLVQGGGGNTSVKTEDGKYMYVKASGTALKDMNARAGWRRLNLKALRDILKDKSLTKLDYNARGEAMTKLLADTCDDNIKTDSRPSVESVLHASLGRCVVHLHATAVGAYVCAKNGRAAVEKMFKDEPIPPLWVPYADPGYSLAKKVAELTEGYTKVHGVAPAILFLQKHGLFVTGNSATSVLRLVRRVINKCTGNFIKRKIISPKHPSKKIISDIQLTIRRAFFKSNGEYVTVRHALDADIAWFLSRNDAGRLISTPVLTPDELVYMLGTVIWIERPDVNLVNSKLNMMIARGQALPAGFLVKGAGLFVAGTEYMAAIAEEVIKSTILVRAYSTKFGGPHPLNKRQQDFINQWEAESFRKKIAGISVAGDLNGRIAVITGAGSGIGRSIALGLARAGALVAVCDVDGDAAEKALCAINEECPCVPAMQIAGNVTSEDDVRKTFEAVLARWGGVDILVNAAGIAPAYSLVDFPVDKLRATLEVNLTGYFLMAKSAAKAMIQQGIGGSIINISSKSGLDASKNNTAYNATKAGEIHMARGWALELGEHGIRVNCIAPGNVFEGSGIWNPTYIRECARKYGISPEEVIPYYINKTALKRDVKGDDIAQAAVFLSSDKARTITGQVLVADGGQVMVR